MQYFSDVCAIFLALYWTTGRNDVQWSGTMKLSVSQKELLSVCDHRYPTRFGRYNGYIRGTGYPLIETVGI